MQLDRSTALVTGGAVRIGRAICERLAAAGCGVVVHYNRSAEAAADLVTRLKERGARALAVQGDLDTEEACEALLDRAWREAGGIDCLVNNAAIFEKDGLAAASRAKVLDELRVNLLAPLTLIRAFAARCGSGPDAGGAPVGKVVNLLDRRIASNETDCVPYLLSKKMLAELTRIAALELAPRIAVNGVAPGAILPPTTRTTPGVAPVRDPAGPAPLRRACTPSDVADAVAFLLQSDAVTGQILYVDGGQHLLGTLPPSGGGSAA